MFIEIEGIDSSGKSTLAKSLAACLTTQGRRVCHLGFPDHQSPTGKLLRGWLAREWTTGDRSIDAMLFQSLQIVNRMDLLPNTNDYHYIIADRYYTSGLVYGAADGLDWDWLLKSQYRLPKPDLSIFMSIPVDVAFARKGAADKDRYEESQSYLHRVADLYESTLERLKGLPGNTVFRTIDGRLPKEAVLDEALKAVKELSP